MKLTKVVEDAKIEYIETAPETGIYDITHYINKYVEQWKDNKIKTLKEEIASHEYLYAEYKEKEKRGEIDKIRDHYPCEDCLEKRALIKFLEEEI